jgi:hypothetical protein
VEGAGRSGIWRGADGEMAARSKRGDEERAEGRGRGERERGDFNAD